MPKSTENPAIYISYAWGSESETIAEQIESEFQKRGLPISRDKKVLNYKGRIKAFMEQIGRADYIILVISDKYLHSANCMFELIQIFKNEHFDERVFPVVLDEVDIYDPTERVRLIKYWEDKNKSLNDEIRKLEGFANIQGVTDDLNLISEIRDDIGKLTQILKDMNTLSIDQHVASNFQELYEAVQKKITSDSAYKTPKNDETKQPNADIAHGPSDKKKRFYEIVQRIVMAVIFLFLVIVVVQRMTNDPMPDEKKGAIDSLAIAEKKKDSLLILEGKLTKDTLISKVIPEEKNDTPLSNIRYDVELFVPSNMANAEVFVDGKRAEIVDRSLISITVRLRKKDSSHHFEVKDGDKSCKTDKLIAEDKVQLTLCE